MIDMANLNALLAEVPDIFDKPGTPAFEYGGKNAAERCLLPPSTTTVTK